MKTYCASKSIKQEFTIPHIPQQNGMAERANRTLVEIARCMLKDSGLDKSYWARSAQHRGCSGTIGLVGKQTNERRTSKPSLKWLVNNEVLSRCRPNCYFIFGQ